jgi:nucleoside phosphorylase
MVGIVYATRREADPFLVQTAAEGVASRPLLSFRIAGEGRPFCTVVISGMGKVAATLAATHLVLAHRVSVLINAGLCGRLSSQAPWSVGDLLRVSTAVEGDCDRFGWSEPAVDCDVRWFSELQSARLVTHDRPVFDSAWRNQLAGIADLADMEGAGVARVARLYGIPCAMLKGISDAADEAGRQDVANHIDWVSGRVADALCRELAIQTTDKQP